MSAVHLHKPYIADDAKVAELTIVPLLVGVALGIVFGGSSLYLALKVGMTVSASIPVAVLAITLFRGFSKAFGLRRATILENNIVQTAGSAGESIAFGVAVTMPALLMMGYEMELSRTLLVAVLGGLLGILMMIPLRQLLIVKEHGKLAYPEGTACAEVLIVGEKGGTSARTLFGGFFLGLSYKVLYVLFRFWHEIPQRGLTWLKGATVACEVSPELLGVGYIIGPRSASYAFAGGILATWVITPIIRMFGDGLVDPLFPGLKPIVEMTSREIWRNYILYIGAGAVAAGGIINLVKNLPLIVKTAARGMTSLRNRGEIVMEGLRTQRDIPMPLVLLGSLLLILTLWFVPILKINLLGAVLVVVFGFLFVLVSSRLTGEIGSSVNPVSGMTVATLLITSLIFLAMGWVTPEDRVSALCVAAVVCIACSNGGTVSQDLKTGFLVGGTPWRQQVAILIGALTSAIVIGFTLNLLNDASTVYSKKIPAGLMVPDVTALTKTEKIIGPEGESDSNEYRVFHLTETPKSGPLAQLHAGKYLVDNGGVIRYLVDPGINGALEQRDDGTRVQKYDAPKARLMSLIIDGILSQKLPWGLVLFGVMIVLVLELCRVNSLAFAVGVYLPISTTMPIFFGGAIRYIVDRIRAKRAVNEVEPEESPGVHMSSGFIAGGAIAGIAIALFASSKHLMEKLNLGAYVPSIAESQWTSIIAFALLALSLFLVGIKRRKRV